MSTENISQQLSELTSKVDGLHQKIDRLDERVAGHDAKFEGIDAKFGQIEVRFETLEKKIDDGFNASKSRDEELLGLRRFGLEADEVLGESLQRSFAESNRKQDAEISLLRDVLKNHAAEQQGS